MSLLPDAKANKNLEGRGARASIQRFGGFLAGMIMPNMGAFIAWGLLTALFIPTGWTPNADLAKMVDPIITYLLPLLIGYTGGRTVHGQRGAVIGALVTMGVIVGSPIPMFLGAMFLGPLAAWLLKQVDKVVQKHTPPGFEMLFDNFSLGILAVVLAIPAALVIEPIVTTAMDGLAGGVDFLIRNSLLPLASLLVEPAKVLFLNNAVNHGILTPLGIAQSQEFGKSILFMVESNPGPGFGLLMAFWLAGPRGIRGSVPGAIIIHLFGGIHEIFFPYVLMKPKMILATIAGAMSGLFVGTLLGAGLVAPASPGSIIAWMLVTPRGGYVSVLAAFVTASVVSFAVAWLLFKMERPGAEDLVIDDETGAVVSAWPSAEDEAEGAAGGTAMAARSVSGADVRKVIIACDAGMGSSVMVASQMRKKLKPYGVEVIHTPVDQIPADAQVVLTHEGLADRARKQAASGTVVVPFKNYMGDPAFTRVEEAIRDHGAITATGAPSATAPATFTAGTTAPAAAATAGAATAAVATAGAATPRTTRPRRAKKKLSSDVLPTEGIRLNLPSRPKDEALRLAGETLVALGAADPAYIDGMFERETQISTYLGNGIAIPHGTNEARAHIRKAALGFLQFPEGVDWDGNDVRIVIPIASNSDEHVGILAALAGVLADPVKAERLRTSTNVEEVKELLAPEEGE